MDNEEFYDLKFKDRVIPKKIRFSMNIALVLAFGEAWFHFHIGIVFGSIVEIIISLVFFVSAFYYRKTYKDVFILLITGVNVVWSMMCITEFGAMYLNLIASITFIDGLISTFKYNQIKRDFENGVNAEFFEGKTFVPNPYENDEEDNVANIIEFIASEKEGGYDCFLSDKGGEDDSDNNQAE